MVEADLPALEAMGWPLSAVCAADGGKTPSNSVMMMPPLAAADDGIEAVKTATEAKK